MHSIQVKPFEETLFPSTEEALLKGPGYARQSEVAHCSSPVGLLIYVIGHLEITHPTPDWHSEPHACKLERGVATKTWTFRMIYLAWNSIRLIPSRIGLATLPA